MKECPDCKKLFTDDLFYCLYDGVALVRQGESVDPSAPTEASYNVGTSDPTQVLPKPVPTTQPSVKVDEPQQQPPPTSSSPSSKLPYVVIGALIMICAGLAAALVGFNLDRIFPRDNKNSAVNDAKPTPTSTPAAANTPPTPNTTKTV